MSEKVNSLFFGEVGDVHKSQCLQGFWRDGRVAEGGGLLNRYTVKSRIGGSNPPLSAIFYKGILTVTHKVTHKFQSSWDMICHK